MPSRAVLCSFNIDAVAIYPHLCPAVVPFLLYRLGLVPGLVHAAVDTYLLRGKAPWTWSHGWVHGVGVGVGEVGVGVSVGVGADVG